MPCNKLPLTSFANAFNNAVFACSPENWKLFFRGCKRDDKSWLRPAEDTRDVVPKRDKTQLTSTMRSWLFWPSSTQSYIPTPQKAALFV